MASDVIIAPADDVTGVGGRQSSGNLAQSQSQNACNETHVPVYITVTPT